jgi:hypothetical protein
MNAPLWTLSRVYKARRAFGFRSSPRSTGLLGYDHASATRRIAMLATQ